MAGVFTNLHAGAPQVLRFAEILSPDLDQHVRSITRASSPHLNMLAPLLILPFEFLFLPNQFET